ncbi:MAG: hypothetical protein FWD92_03185 [Methanomassiliicoccaceae archaeon]|nr:hypothetical protein [Methanomassiliicoccaceae archaeon]
MNRTEGTKFRDTYIKYYNVKQVEGEDLAMLDRLVRAEHIKYSIREGKAYAEATEGSKKLHSIRPPRPSI